MKNMKFLLYALLFFIAVGILQGCKEDIDMSNRYTFTEYTIASYLEAHEDYSEFYRLLTEVRVSDRTETNVLQLLSARGNYTVFAPSNKAIQDYLDTLCAKGIITEASWDGFKNDHDKDSIREVIVFNCIIDGEDLADNLYQTGNFPEDKEEFSISNMYDRKLSICYGKNPDSMYINGVKDNKDNITGGSLIDLQNHDIMAINGFIHQVQSVIAPSNETLADILQSYIDTNEEGFLVMAKLVLACGLRNELTKVKDEVYERAYKNGEINDLPNHSSEGSPGYVPIHRKFGYTLFAETDEFWEQNIGNGKTAKEITLEDVKEWVKEQGFYPNAVDDGDYTNTNNVLNQFVTYHILPMRLPVNRLVIHYLEKGYNYSSSSNFTIPVWEYYTTLGERRLLKLYQSGKRFSIDNSDAIYLNRFPTLDNGRHGTYGETACDMDKEGIVIKTAEARSVINGYIYPIEKPLAYSRETRENFQKERIRFDVTAMFPEFMNNDIRANRVNNARNQTVGIPTSTVYPYLDDLEIEEGTQFYYLLGLGKQSSSGWTNFQGDELNVIKKYSMIFRLPPVPLKGTYEIRYAVQVKSGVRGMCQVYFGTDKDNLHAQGIPLDLRMGGKNRVTANGTFPSIAGWVEDISDDDDTNAENDKKMRNNGFMKGPEYFQCWPGGSTSRQVPETIRRIIVREDMDPNKTYYLKFKNVLDDDIVTTQFFMDYLEICAKEVYDNPMTPEDIW